ncbi:solute carrier family 28 member 3-like [Diadema antillarum]|uniref:solute carrier family 28 member 3-like n=1 Tax=Diadema antillarum TaxID=105358 RepID=UPI003A8A589C
MTTMEGKGQDLAKVNGVQDASVGVELDLLEPGIEDMQDGIPASPTNTHTLTNDEDPEKDELPYTTNCCTERVERVEKNVVHFYHANYNVIHWACYGTLLLLYLVYLIYVLARDVYTAMPLFILTMLLVTILGWRWLWRRYSGEMHTQLVGWSQSLTKQRKVTIKGSLYIGVNLFLVVLAAATGVFASIAKEPRRLISVLGLFFMLFVSVLVSKYPGRIRWKTVYWGIYLQLFLGILILRTKPGFTTFNWLGTNVEIFLNYTTAGSTFVFGPAPLELHSFLFVALPVIIFTSSVCALLYYFGIMQVIIKALAFIMHFTMATSGAESFAAASNIFVGMTTAPLAIKPYLKDMTNSELHSMMTGGFATIAGNMLAIYITFGISPAHLLSASIISAPAALAVAKIFYPETRRPKTARVFNVEVEKVPERNCLEAFFNGAADGLKICAYIICNILASLAFLAFVNAVLRWLGIMAGVENLSFQLICRYVFFPLAWILGTSLEDCGLVAELIGTKTFLNEFIAYSDLSERIKEGTVSARTQVIATYALCGFTNLGSLGVMLGSMVPLIPSRMPDVSKLVFRALVAGSVACLLTSCVAGFLYDPERTLFGGEKDPLTTLFPNVSTLATTMTPVS